MSGKGIEFNEEWGLITAGIKGRTPLMLHSPESLNPESVIVKKYKELSSIIAKNRSENEKEELGRIGYLLALYWDADQEQVYIPAEMIAASMAKGATHWKLGKEVKCSLLIAPSKIPLIYDGPRTVQELWDDKNFVDVRPVKVMQSKILRVRPIFATWELEFEIQYSKDSTLDVDSLKTILRRAGMHSAIGDYRPSFGRFEVTKFQDKGVIEW